MIRTKQLPTMNLAERLNMVTFGMMISYMELPEHLNTAWINQKKRMDHRFEALRYGKQNNEHTMAPRHAESYEIFRSDPVNETTPVMGSIPMARVPVRDVKGNSVYVHAMTDSGASASIISKELVDRAGLFIDRPNTKSMIKVANGNTMTTAGMIRLEVNWFDVIIIIHAIVTSAYRNKYCFWVYAT